MLKQNTSILGQYPFRLLGGGVAFLRPMYARADRINALSAYSSTKAAVPSGHLAPSAWILPRQAGGIASRNEANITFNSQGNAAAGINMEGASSFTFSTSGIAAAIASLNGSVNIVFSGSGSLNAPLNAIGTASISFSSSAALSATARIQGTASISVSSLASLTALAHMLAVPISTELTPAAIAEAVWSALATLNNSPGSLGEKLNDAGSASNPWTETIEGSLTAADLLRLLVAVAAGDATGLEGSTITFKSLDGTTDRIVATLTNGTRTITDLDPA